MTRLIISFLICSYCFAVKAAEQNNFDMINYPYSQSTQGGIGLIQIPTARFSEDGEFGFGIATEAPYNRVYAKMQFFPWMEAIVKYAQGTYLPYGEQPWTDKAFDIKLQLLKEENIGFNLAFGLIDFVGTGDYSSEYLVASKHIGNFDWTVGLGWGRLGGVGHLNNIAGWLDDDRRTRGGYSDAPRGGSISIDRFFSGKYNSIFSGVEYFTPINNLSLKLEYDTSDYSSVIGREMVFDEMGDLFELKSRFNYALNYRVNLGDRDKIDFSLGVVRGNTLYANLAVHSNLNFSGAPKVILGAEKIRNTNLPGGETFGSLDQNRKEFLFNRTIREMANIGFITHAIIYDEDEISAEISQSRFQNSSKAIDLASRVLANNSPRNIKKLTIINIDNGIETFRSTVQREELIKSVSLGPLNSELVEFNLPVESGSDQIIVKNDFLYPNFYWEIRPKANHTLQHQEKFFFWQLEALIHTVYSINKGLYLTTDFGIDLANNFEEYTYHIPDGLLHHVRQDRRLYLTEGKSGLRRMQLDYLIDISPNVKAKLSAGILEWMYGGFGGEIIYMPTDKRWGLSLDAYWVKQRDFDQSFSFQDYETLTGFINYYQDIPFYDMRLKVSAGKFLGKDVGTMIDLSRRFANGARVGGFAALTDCDPGCVGEGSFHKGVYFELPIDLFYIQSSTRGSTGYAWSPLTKDAGAKLETAGLYPLMVNAPDEIDSLRQKSWSLKKIFSGFGIKPESRKNLQ